MIFFRYRRYLEQQIAELKEENRRLEEKNDKLTEALVPILRRMNEKTEKPTTAQEIVEKKQEHKILKSEGHAECKCGWSTDSQDPAELQNEIANHHRKIVNSLRGGRKSWIQIKTMLEEGVAS